MYVMLAIVGRVVCSERADPISLADPISKVVTAIKITDTTVRKPVIAHHKTFCRRVSMHTRRLPGIAAGQAGLGHPNGRSLVSSAFNFQHSTWLRGSFDEHVKLGNILTPRESRTASVKKSPSSLCDRKKARRWHPRVRRWAQSKQFVMAGLGSAISNLVKWDAEVHPLSEFESVICEHVLVGAVEQL